jgi:hypothetical protein
VKKQLICPGYKSQFDIAWKDQNVVAARSVQRRKKATENAYLKQLVAERLSNLPSPATCGYLIEDRVDYAVKFFFSSYILLPEQTEMQRGILDCLYPIWTQAQPSSPLKVAVGAVASYLLEAWSQLDPARSPLSTSLYLRGVAALRRTIDSTGDVEDDVLMAALMLQMYENLRAFKTSQFSGDVHVSGAAALIRQQRRPFASVAAQRLLLGTRNQIVGRALRGSTAMSPAVVTWTSLTPDIPKRPSHRLDEINMDVADFQAVVSGFSSGTSTQAGFFSCLLDTARQLDQRLLDWLTTVPTWMPCRVFGLECVPQTVRNAGTYQDYCDIYRNVFVADQLNSQRCSRIRIHSSFLTCLPSLEAEDLNALSVMSQGVIQDLADDICACVPFYLGDRVDFTRFDDKTAKYPHIDGVSVPDSHHSEAAAYAGWFLTGRLAELLSVQLPLRDGQRQWIGGQIQRLKRLYTIQG